MRVEDEKERDEVEEEGEERTLILLEEGG